MKKKMVVGFCFPAHDLVYLIKKTRPEWQAGLMNGIGGHVEEDETPEEAMIREFEEEAGVRIENWVHVAVMEGEDWHLDVFACDWFYKEEAKTMTDEEIKCCYIHRLYFEPTIPNTRFLVPMCREHLDNKNTYKTARFIY